ncbi:hypothetical protein CALCODRAFT_91224 [Calocera cornea HHB12733]|uniref:Uncharacterized protein n=1 Tax=Calocera cornea HHB12733 TaxID=1353952 RepID=A0A165DAU8_9BASI|nr:hypothetical protein CALCODRAFT_91224 [Calocera cornea HHB12733]
MSRNAGQGCQAIAELPERLAEAEGNASEGRSPLLPPPARRSNALITAAPSGCSCFGLPSMVVCCLLWGISTSEIARRFGC